MSDESNLEVFKNFLFTQWVIAYPSSFGLMCIFYVIYLYIKNPGLVDVAWEFTHLLVGSIMFGLHSWGNYVRPIVFYVLLFIWFLRLGGYIFITRIVPGEKDPRYEKMAEDAKSPLLYFFIQYQLQAFLVSITSIPLYFVFQSKLKDDLTWSFYIGASLVFIGIIGEAIADQQLYNYKERVKEERRLAKANLIGQSPQKRGIFAEGLWRRSRHPNLFFEQVIWIGFAIGGISGWIDLIGFIGPIVLHLIMRYLTVPITEQYMRDTRKEQYEQFCLETNMFWII